MPANFINGTDDDDVLTGTDLNDLINGRLGNDDIDGDAGNDVLDGGDGDDTISGGDGNDTIFALLGNDLVFAGNGNDSIEGGTGDTIIFGGAGSDTVRGGSGNDSIDGGSGDDILVADDTGDEGSDTLIGGYGSDFISGGGGDDILNSHTGRGVSSTAIERDEFYGGAGADTFNLFSDYLGGKASRTNPKTGDTSKAIIFDFRRGVDTLNLLQNSSRYTVSSTGNYFGKSTTDTVISLNGNVVAIVVDAAVRQTDLGRVV